MRCQNLRGLLFLSSASWAIFREELKEGSSLSVSHLGLKPRGLCIWKKAEAKV